MAEMQKVDRQYHRQAVGPAGGEVLEKGHRELNQLGDLLKKIPGQPCQVEVIGRGPDQVKLSWQPPEKNLRLLRAMWCGNKRRGSSGR